VQKSIQRAYTVAASMLHIVSTQYTCCGCLLEPNWAINRESMHLFLADTRTIKMAVFFPKAVLGAITIIAQCNLLQIVRELRKILILILNSISKRLSHG
jgi:hypothetical protein